MSGGSGAQPRPATEVGPNGDPARWPESDDDALRSLRRRWWLVVAAGFGALLATAWGLERCGLATGRWLASATPVLVWLMALTGARLGEHRVGGLDGHLLPRFGPGTTLSLIRAVVLALFSGFLLLPRPEHALAWLPMVLYTFFVVADFFDGYLARRTATSTALGARLDQELDALGILVVVLIGLRWGQLPPWYLLVGAARYLYGWLVVRRQGRGLPVHELPPSRNRRLWAGFQMGFLSAVLWPIVPAAGARLAAWCFGLPFLLGFLRDTLVVCGWIDADGERYRRLRDRLGSVIFEWLPPLLRLVLAAVVASWLGSWSMPLQPPGWKGTIEAWGWAGPSAIAALGAAAFLLGSLMVTLGLLARLGTLLMTLGFAIQISGHSVDSGHGVDSTTGLALVAALLVMLLGPGRLSLWQPEEEALRRQAGAGPAS